MNGLAVRRLAGTVVLVVVTVVLVLTLRRQGADARDALAGMGLGQIALALTAVLGGLFASLQVWRVVLAELGSPLRSRDAMQVFFVGQLGKYLPGSVFAVAAQMELGRVHRVPRARAAASWLVFMGILVVTGLLCGVLTLPLTIDATVGRYGWLLGGLPLGLACLAPPVLNRLLGLGLRALRRPPIDRPLTWSGVGQATGWAMAMWALYGVHLVLLVDSFDAEPGYNLPLIAVGGFALAWTAGLLFVIAPAGAGVREAVLVIALAPVLSVPEATAVALVSRLLLTVGDVVWACVGAMLTARRRHRRHAADDAPRA